MLDLSKFYALSDKISINELPHLGRVGFGDSLMRGIVFTAFLTFLDERRDFGVSNRVLNESEADLETSAFTSVNHYPSRDLKALLASATRILDEPFSEMVKEFGEFLFDHLMYRLSMHVENYDTWQSMLINVEDTIHESIHKLEPKRRIPVALKQVEEANTALTLHYKSPRGMADLAEGLIMGCLKHYSAEQAVTIVRFDQSADGTSSIFKMTYEAT